MSLRSCGPSRLVELDQAAPAVVPFDYGAYVATFDERGDVLSGAWTYPGGGYSATSTRVAQK